MKLFLGYLLLCFTGAIVLRKKNLKLNMWLLFGLCLLVSIGYFFFHQI